MKLIISRYCGFVDEIYNSSIVLEINSLIKRREEVEDMVLAFPQETQPSGWGTTLEPMKPVSTIQLIRAGQIEFQDSYESIQSKGAISIKNTTRASEKHTELLKDKHSVKTIFTRQVDVAFPDPVIPDLEVGIFVKEGIRPEPGLRRRNFERPGLRK